MTQLRLLLLISGLALLPSCRTTPVRHPDPDDERKSRVPTRRDASDRARREALAALSSSSAPDPVWFYLEAPDRAAGVAARDAALLEDLVEPLIEDLELYGDLDARRTLPIFELIDSLRHEDYLGIEGWRIGPGNLTIRTELGGPWRFEFGYGRHVRGTAGSYGGLVDDLSYEQALEGRHLPGLNSLGFSFTRRVK